MKLSLVERSVRFPIAVLGIVILALVPLSFAQPNEGALDQGKAIFRSNCAFCHGLTAQGGRGPSLISSALLHGDSNDAIKNVITRGVPGTTMPSFDMQKDDLDNLVLFLRSLSGSNSTNVKVPGDIEAGEKLYARNGCSNCHRIGNTGSTYGPELTRIGAGRSLDYLRESLVDPSADIAENYGGVTVVTREGRRVSGVRVNEDTFTVQIRKPDQAFALFDKAQVKEVIHETKSMMPAYNHLSAVDLQNLLAYLTTLRGSQSSGADANKAQGIH
ncbi:MAG TPA: c-type cytochrome [Bryobacteraceae bacterium]|jgi:putative heme-binding domain-containing protein